MAAGGSLMKAGVTNVMNGLEEGRIDWGGLGEIALGGAISYISGKGMACNFKGVLSTGDNPARGSRIAETANETMAGGKGSRGSANAAEPPSAYGKGRNIETNGFGPDTVINRNANYGAKAADPSYGVSNKPIGDYQLGTNTPSGSSYVTGTSRMGMAAGAEEKIWLKASDGTGVTGTPGRKVAGSLGSAGLFVWNANTPDVPEIMGIGSKDNITVQDKLDKLLNSNYYKENSGYDCSEIAQDFFDAANQQGKIYRIEGVNGYIYGYEYGVKHDYYYHEVYSDGIYIYDPRYSNKRVLKDDYFRALREINLDGFNAYEKKV